MEVTAQNSKVYSRRLETSKTVISWVLLQFFSGEFPIWSTPALEISAYTRLNGASALRCFASVTWLRPCALAWNTVGSLLSSYDVTTCRISEKQSVLLTDIDQWILRSRAQDISNYTLHACIYTKKAGVTHLKYAIRTVGSMLKLMICVRRSAMWDMCFTGFAIVLLASARVAR